MSSFTTNTTNKNTTISSRRSRSLFHLSFRVSFKSFILVVATAAGILFLIESQVPSSTPLARRQRQLRRFFNRNKNDNDKVNHWDILKASVISQNTTTTFQNNNNLGPYRRSCGECCNYGPIEDGDNYKLVLVESWYRQVLNFKGTGFLIAASENVQPIALYEAALNLDRLTQQRPDFIQQLINEGVHMTVMGVADDILEVPEYSICLEDRYQYARGWAATCCSRTTSVSEENLLCSTDGDDPYQGYNLMVHETAHTLTGNGGSLPDPRYVEPGKADSGTIQEAVDSLYETAVVNDGKWNNTLAAVNALEYFAQGATIYFNGIATPGPPEGNGQVNDIVTRQQLQQYDLPLYELLTKLFPTTEVIPTIPCPGNKACDCDTFQCPQPVQGLPDPPRSCPSALSTLYRWMTNIGRETYHFQQSVFGGGDVGGGQ